jgi:hypothetical protein
MAFAAHGDTAGSPRSQRDCQKYLSSEAVMLFDCLSELRRFGSLEQGWNMP